MEVLGYHKLAIDEELYFNDVFNAVPVILPSIEVFNEARKLRKTHNMKLGDSIIAGTALVNNLSLYTRNITDFENIPTLKLVDPII